MTITTVDELEHSPETAAARLRLRGYQVRERTNHWLVRQDGVDHHLTLTPADLALAARLSQEQDQADVEALLVALKAATGEDTEPAPTEPPGGYGLQNLPIALIRRDGGTQARVGLSEDAVAEYTEAMREGRWDFTPPLGLGTPIVHWDAEGYWLADGFHRVEAAQRAGLKTIHVQVLRGGKRAAVFYACKANAEHGLKRTREDVRRAIATLLRDAEWRQWSNAEIARHVATSDKTVAAVRTDLESTSEIPRLAERRGADGKVRAVQAEPKAAAVAEMADDEPKTDADHVKDIRRYLDQQRRAGHIHDQATYKTACDMASAIAGGELYRATIKEIQAAALLPGVPALPPAPWSAEEKNEEPAPFWQAISPNHPTAHHWTRAGMYSWRSACGMTASRQPSGSMTAGHCGKCAASPTRPDAPAGWVWRDNGSLRRIHDNATVGPYARLADVVSAAEQLDREREGKPGVWFWGQSHADADLAHQWRQIGPARWESRCEKLATAMVPASAGRRCPQCQALMSGVVPEQPQCGEAGCTEPSIGSRNIAGLKIHRCQAHTEEAEHEQARDILRAVCERAEALGATVDYLRQGTGGRISVIPPAGYQQAELWCNAQELEDLCRAWEKHARGGSGQQQEAATGINWHKVDTLALNLGTARDAGRSLDFWFALGQVLLPASPAPRADAARLIQLLAPLIETYQTECLEDLSKSISDLNERREGEEAGRWIAVGRALLDLAEEG